MCPEHLVELFLFIRFLYRCIPELLRIKSSKESNSLGTSGRKIFSLFMYLIPYIQTLSSLRRN
ncbi:hypothetical protein Mapa_010278 [Marchantia paleacea]|nr:hypothetical protein Mapa_010278 [Marchantia paleacea]